MAALPRFGGETWPAPIEALNEGGLGDIVLVCEHASNLIPAELGALGLSAADAERHIAYDIGARDLTRALSERLDAPAFLGTVSRLLVDLNRPWGVPSSVPEISEATPIPGNAGLAPDELERRRQHIFEPFHAHLSAFLDRRERTGRPVRLVTVHSFTPVFLGECRPWHAGVAFDRDWAWAEAVKAALEAEGGLTVGLNLPYPISRDEDYAVPVYGTDRGLPALLIEVRNDGLRDAEGVRRWADRLAAALGPAPP